MKLLALSGIAFFLASGIAAQDDVALAGPVFVNHIEARVELLMDEAGDKTFNIRAINEFDPVKIKKRACSHNNCLRALIARPAQASAFCATYTTAATTTVGTFTQCKDNVAVSSACSCQYPAPTAPACNTGGANCDLEDFSACCNGCSLYPSATVGTCSPATTTV